MHKIQIQYSKDTIHTYPALGGAKEGEVGGVGCPVPAFIPFAIFSHKIRGPPSLDPPLNIHILLQFPTRVFSLQDYVTILRIK